MKKMLTACAAVLMLAVLTGCCRDKCHNPPCTASCSDCCGEEKNDSEKSGKKNAMDHSEKHNGKDGKDHSSENLQKISSR